MYTLPSQRQHVPFPLAMHQTFFALAFALVFQQSDIKVNITPNIKHLAMHACSEIECTWISEVQPSKLLRCFASQEYQLEIWELGESLKKKKKYVDKQPKVKQVLTSPASHFKDIFTKLKVLSGRYDYCVSSGYTYQTKVRFS